MRDLYASHETGLQVVFSEVERYALSQEEVFAGTPGSLTRRPKSSGSVFYSRQYYDGSGKKRDPEATLEDYAEFNESLSEVRALRATRFHMPRERC